MKQIPWWLRTSSVAAPILLIGGWSVAAALQPSDYDPLRDTISALAARGATDRWVMTAALGGLGICHLVTAYGLRPARPVGRVILGIGGIATFLVATFPQPANGNSTAHTFAAIVAFSALGTWPLFAARRQSPAAPLLTAKACVSAATVLLGLAAWFAFDLHGGQRGLSERGASGAQALWPLAVVWTSWRAFATSASRTSLPR